MTTSSTDATKYLRSPFVLVWFAGVDRGTFVLSVTKHHGATSPKFIGEV